MPAGDRKKDKRVKARNPKERSKARQNARQGSRKGISVPENVRLMFVEHLMRGFKETDLPHATRRLLGMGPRATRAAQEAVRQRWLEKGLQAPAEALRSRELENIDEVLHHMLFDKKGKVIEATLLDMPSVVKLLQLRDRVTERFLKNEELLRRRPKGFLGADVDLSSADELEGDDEFEFVESEPAKEDDDKDE